jgi:hypothetical protein
MPTVLAKAVELLGVTVQPGNGLGSNGFKCLGFALAHLSWVLLGQQSKQFGLVWFTVRSSLV